MYAQRPVRAAMLLRLLRHAARHPVAGWQCIRVVRAYRRAQEFVRLHPTGGAAGSAQLLHTAQSIGLDEDTTRCHVERWMEAEPLSLISHAIRPGLTAFVEAARASGMRVGVFSDYPAEAKLRAMGVRGLVDVVRSAHDDERGRFKPDPAGLLDVAAALGVAPAQTVYVGDRPDVDAVAAERAGMACFIITTKQRVAPGEAWIPVEGFVALTRVLLPPS